MVSYQPSDRKDSVSPANIQQNLRTVSVRCWRWCWNDLGFYWADSKQTLHGINFLPDSSLGLYLDQCEQQRCLHLPIDLNFSNQDCLTSVRLPAHKSLSIYLDTCHPSFIHMDHKMNWPKILSFPSYSRLIVHQHPSINWETFILEGIMIWWFV